MDLARSGKEHCLCSSHQSFTCPIATAVLVGKIDLTRCKIMLYIQNQCCSSFHFNIYSKSKLPKPCINSANEFARYSKLTEVKSINTSYTQLFVWFPTTKTFARRTLLQSKRGDTCRAGFTGRILNKTAIRQEKHHPHQDSKQIQLN